MMDPSGGDNNGTLAVAGAAASSENVELVGSRQNGLVVVHPEEGEVLDMIKTIKARLQELAYIKKIQKWILNSSVDRTQEDADSARYIQGNRIEMFLDVHGKSSAAFDEILGPKLPPNAKGRIIEYAKHQALKDLRMKEQLQQLQNHNSNNNSNNSDDAAHDGWEFDNFSLLITYGKVKPQAPHLDALRPLFQFGLMVSDKTPSTMIYDGNNEDGDNEHDQSTIPMMTTTAAASASTTTLAPTESISELQQLSDPIEQLKRHWIEMMTAELSMEAGSVAPATQEGEGESSTPPTPSPPQIPSAIIKVLDEEQSNSSKSVIYVLLQDYGSVFQSWQFVNFYKRMKQVDTLRTGTVMSMPGGVIHAGAKSQKMRAVIFYSARPKSSNVDQYDPNTQWISTTLAYRLISLLWYKPGIAFDERVFLLRRLAQYVEGCTIKDTSTLCPLGLLTDFIVAIEKKSYAPNQTKEEFIQQIADSSDLVAPVIDLTEYKNCQQQHDLYTMYEGEEQKVVVHHRVSDNKVILGYPPAVGSLTDGDGFEGHKPDDNYRVVMKPGHESEIFDGTNALHLLDTDGDIFHVYKKGEGGDDNNLLAKNNDTVGPAKDITDTKEGLLKRSSPSPVEGTRTDGENENVRKQARNE